MKDEAKIRQVKSKLGLGADLQNTKIETSISEVKVVDGKISATVYIDGPPVDKSYKGDLYGQSHKRIPKIFNNFQEFSSYAEELFNKPDDEIINLWKGK